MSAGDFVLVLHGHMPWVMGHGRWPHGESWLYEAAAGVYLPLLGVVEECHAAGARAPITLGLTPVLLEQLRHPDFRRGFQAWLDDRCRRADLDASAAADPHQRWLAARWQAHFTALSDQLQALHGDIVEGFASQARAGRIELLSSYATHGYGPLLLHDGSIRAQLRTGLDTSERHLGFRPKGVWLPECAFRPGGPWTPPVLHGDERSRTGIDRILEQEGVTHFFVDAHLFGGARSEGVMLDGHFEKVGWDAAESEPSRGWRTVMEPHRVGTHGGPSEVIAFARHPRVSEQVWSGDVGYPGDGRYLEFHKKRGTDGLRYWRVTDSQADLGVKDWYQPDWVQGAVHEHAAHFADAVRQSVEGHMAATGRRGVVVAPFDAELFGHWWFEGPTFLRDVLLSLHHDPAVTVRTAEERLAAEPTDKVVWLPEGSWGDGGDHRVWLNDRVMWTLEAEYRAEDRFLGMLYDVEQRRGEPVHERAERLLKKVARELLLLQASDWAFVVTTGGAVEYGYRRLSLHHERFERLANALGDLLRGEQPGPLAALHEQEADAHDDCFEQIDLSAWT